MCVFRHVVLGVHHASLYGALGLSRRQDLMYKPLEYKVSDAITHPTLNYMYRPFGVKCNGYLFSFK